MSDTLQRVLTHQADGHGDRQKVEEKEEKAAVYKFRTMDSYHQLTGLFVFHLSR